MRKLFRSSKPTTTEGQSPENKDGSKTSPSKDDQKAKKKKRSSFLPPKQPSVAHQYPYLSNIPQLVRADDAEVLANALAAEVVADNADAGIPAVLLKATPAPLDLTKAPPNLRRGSVLKSPRRLNSVSSESGEGHSPTSEAVPNTLLLSTSPPLSPSSPRSNSVASRASRARVKFDITEKIILEAQEYSHQQRFTIASGNFLHFDRPPTANYRFSTTTESIHTKGTLLQLVTSASSDDEKNTWDSLTSLPLYAARYYNPCFTSTERTVYWEADIRSLGFSRFSSVDHSNGEKLAPPTPRPPPTPLKNNAKAPGSPRPSDLSPNDEGLAELGLSRSISHTNPIPKRMTGSAIAIGFIVKSVTPDTVPFLRRRSSLRPVDEFPFPSSTAGDGIFWSSDHGGTVYIQGQQTRHSVPAGVGDTVGIGMTYRTPESLKTPNGATPVPTPPTTPTPPPKDTKDMFKRKASTANGPPPDEPCADPKDLHPGPVELFFVVNGEKKLSIHHPDLSTNPFDPAIPEYMLGQFDIFPCICVQGAGVECKTRIGQAVNWQGAGGSTEPRPAPEETESAATNGSKDKAAAATTTTKETPKKSGRWWTHLGR